MAVAVVVVVRLIEFLTKFGDGNSGALCPIRSLVLNVVYLLLSSVQPRARALIQTLHHLSETVSGNNKNIKKKLPHCVRWPMVQQPASYCMDLSSACAHTKNGIERLQNNTDTQTATDLLGYYGSEYSAQKKFLYTNVMFKSMIVIGAIYLLNT